MFFYLVSIVSDFPRTASIISIFNKMGRMQFFENSNEKYLSLPLTLDERVAGLFTTWRPRTHGFCSTFKTQPLFVKTREKMIKFFLRKFWRLRIFALTNFRMIRESQQLTWRTTNADSYAFYRFIRAAWAVSQKPYESTTLCWRVSKQFSKMLLFFLEIFSHNFFIHLQIRNMWRQYRREISSTTKKCQKLRKGTLTHGIRRKQPRETISAKNAISTAWTMFCSSANA